VKPKVSETPQTQNLAPDRRYLTTSKFYIEHTIQKEVLELWQLIHVKTNAFAKA